MEGKNSAKYLEYLYNYKIIFCWGEKGPSGTFHNIDRKKKYHSDSTGDWHE